MFKYDVFLSFRGEDTRKNFVDNLYHALKQKGIYTYKDDQEIKKGKEISDQLIGSIEQSKIFIIVFSRNYASSSWCLDELSKIMECKTDEQAVYPVFYDVEPTEVRNQSGAVGEAFNKHVNEEAVGRWRAALKEAAGLAGWELKNTFDGHEAMFIRKIVEEISLKLSTVDLSGDGKLVGMETRVRDVVSSLAIDIDDDVRIIGVKGIGGGGKTTLSRVVFNQICVMFEGSSFVENVREASKGSLGGLKSLQKQILSDVLHDPNIIVKDVSDFKKMLCGRKVLVVLDDVDHINQLESLAGDSKWFKPGSRIIITTREEQVLVAHGVPNNLIFDVNLLSHEEASCLFRKYSFGRVTPNQGYDMLSNQVVRYAAGLPLTIKVLGSFLCGKDELEWTDALERLKTIPLKETLEILELSYKSLEEDYKEIFLDVACILKGWEKEKAVTALESCGLHGRNGLRVLEQKSLINVSSTGHLSMHDHIEEMGKNIVRRLHPNEPHRHSRLWITEEIKDIFIEDKVWFKVMCKVEKTNTYLHDATECIKVQWVDPVIVMKGLRKMTELRLLYMAYEGKDSHIKYGDHSGVPYFDHKLADYINIGGGSLYLPNSLQYLRWDGYPFKSLPKKFQANNLVGLTMVISNMDQLCGGKKRKVLKKLRFIDLSYCKLRSMDTGLIPNLERLTLINCKKMVEFQIPIRNSNLRYLNLCGSSLRTLDLAQAQNLKTLIIQVCYNLTELRMPVESLKLKHLILHNLGLFRLRTLNITPYQNLETLHLECKDLLELHMPDENLNLKHIILENLGSTFKTLNFTRYQNLETLHLECKDLTEIHMPIESPELETIEVSCSNLNTLNLIGAENLEALGLLRSEDLVELHIPIECTKLKTIIISCPKLRDLVELHMPIESPKLKSISILCSKLKKLNLTRTQNLERLDIEQCKYFLELHMLIESPTINIRCSKLRTLNLTLYRNLKSLNLEQCENLVELHMPVESPELKTINIHCSNLRTLNLTGAQNLEMLGLSNCENLLKLHMPIESPNLKTINIRRSKLRTLNLTRNLNLEQLDLEQCEDMVELLMPVESPELKSINIRCSKLRTLNLMECRNLERLEIEQCEEFVEVYMPTESPKLKTINIRCSKLRPFYLGPSPNLERLDFHGCFNLVEINAPAGSLSSRVRIKPFVVNQDFHMVGSIAELHLIVRSLGVCPLHPDSSFPKFHFDCMYKELLPLTTQHLKKLISFGHCACNLVGLSESICGSQRLRKLTIEGNISEVPKEIEHLECLEELTLLSTNIEHLPDSICKLKHLKVLQLKSCCFLKQLPEDLGRLEHLEELILTNCISLPDIPNSICELKRLKRLHLADCI